MVTKKNDRKRVDDMRMWDECISALVIDIGEI